MTKAAKVTEGVGTSLKEISHSKYAKQIREIEVWLTLLESLNHFPNPPSCFPLEFTTWERYAGQRNVEAWLNHMCEVNYSPAYPSLMRREIDELEKKKVDVSEYEPLFVIYKIVYFARLRKQIENEFIIQRNYPVGFDSSAATNIRRYLEESKNQRMDADYIKNVEDRLPALDICCAMTKAKNAANQWPGTSYSTGKGLIANDVYGLIEEACCFRLNKREKAEMDGLAVSFTKKWMDFLLDAKGRMEVEKICRLIELARCQCQNNEDNAKIDKLTVSFTEKILERLTDAQTQCPGCYSVEKTKLLIRRADILWVDVSTIKALLPQIDAACKLDEKTHPIRLKLSYLGEKVREHKETKRGRKEILQHDAGCLAEATAEIKKIKEEGFEVSDLEQQAEAIKAEIENAGGDMKII